MNTPPKRAAIYARSATGENAALAKQIEKCKAYARVNGYQVAEQHVYEDPPRSGLASLEQSPSLVKILYAAQAGEISALLVTNRSRISRKLGDIKQFITLLARCHVETIILDEQEDAGIIQSLYEQWRPERDKRQQEAHAHE